MHIYQLLGFHFTIGTTFIFSASPFSIVKISGSLFLLWASSPVSREDSVWKGAVDLWLFGTLACCSRGAEEQQPLLQPKISPGPSDLSGGASVVSLV